MNIYDSINKVTNIVKKYNEDKEYAVVFQNIKSENNTTVYIPIDIIEGVYNSENLTFNGNNKVFNHILLNPKKYGIAFSSSISKAINNRKYIPFLLQKKYLIKQLQEFYYIFNTNKDNIPLLGVQSIYSSDNVNILYDRGLLEYYVKNYPNAKEIISLLEKEENPNKIEINIKTLFEELKETIKDQDDNIKKILMGISKHYIDNMHYNIFVNGNDILPKKRIFKEITNNSNIPFVISSTVNNYEITSVEEMLISLLENTNMDLERAENGMIIIDGFEKLIVNENSNDSFITAQYDIVSLLQGKTFEVIYNKKKYYFDTSKLMIIGLGNYPELENNDVTIAGFNSKNNTIKKESSKEKMKIGMLLELFDNFQMIIDLDNPTIDNYINLLNKEYKNKIKIKDINVNLTDDFINTIAEIFYKNNFSIADINQYLESIIANAYFEYSLNPSDYEELIITSDTIKDNKKYTLVKRKEENM